MLIAVTALAAATLVLAAWAAHLHRTVSALRAQLDRVIDAVNNHADHLTALDCTQYELEYTLTAQRAVIDEMIVFQNGTYELAHAGD